MAIKRHKPEEIVAKLRQVNMENKGVFHGPRYPPSTRLRRRCPSRLGALDGRRQLGSALVGAFADLRWRDSHRGSAPRQCLCSNRAALDSAFQRRGSGRPGRWQIDRHATTPERDPSHTKSMLYLM